MWDMLRSILSQWLQTFNVRAQNVTYKYSKIHFYFVHIIFSRQETICLVLFKFPVVPVIASEGVGTLVRSASIEYICINIPW